MKKYEILEHTADIRARIFSKTQEDLFVNSAICLFELLTDKKLKADKIKSVELEASKLEDLLILWLNELISIFYADKFFPVEYKISIKEFSGTKKLFAEIKGQDFNPYDSKSIKSEIKAATYHNLKIEEDRNGFIAEIIFDV
ncbi:MAG: archease [Candidatus Omnitrophica bacterium]|jgi:SHS2 domain-containing protein|nr:archease [Candidatus Omnitrophota bacterium]